MLLEAGFISFWFAPRGFTPGLGALDPPSRLSLFLLKWEMFRIYFESGLVKLMSGDVHWRNLTAMDEYYQNGPLPAWPGWYVQHLPHWYHAGTAALTLIVELFIIWAMWMPRRIRIACFAVITALQVGIIATANYAFLNYLVLMLGFLLLDDRAIAWVRARVARMWARMRGKARVDDSESALATSDTPAAVAPQPPRTPRVVLEAIALGWIFYATIWAFLAPGSSSVLVLPARALAPFRIANAYGLFATMTEHRYEIEFQGSNDGGRTWTAYPFRYKPQDHHRASRDLRAVSAALRMESLVRVARAAAVLDVGARRAGAARGRERRGALALPSRPVRRTPARHGAHGAVAVLVHGCRDQARDRRVVATPAPWRIRGHRVAR